MTDYNIDGIPITIQNDPLPILAPKFTSCANCGASSSGRCCTGCWSRLCTVCGAVITRQQSMHIDHRGPRHSACDGGQMGLPKMWLA